MTATLPPQLRFQPLVLGAPIPGGVVKFYVAGTTTPQNVYADDGTTPIGTSLTLDANGATDFRLGTGLAYKIDLKMPDGLTSVTGWPKDNIIGSDGVLSNLADTTSPGNGDALIGVKSAAAGSVPTTQHEVNARTVSVNDFGAVAGQDIKTALQAALNAVSSGGKVTIPAGSYTLSAGITIPGTGITIEGASNWGTKITYTGTQASLFRTSNQASSGEAFNMRDIWLQLKNSGDIGIDLTSFSMSQLQRVRIWGGTSAGTAVGVGIKLSAQFASAYADSIVDCDIRYCNQGVYITQGASCGRMRGGQILTCVTGVYADGVGATLADDWEFSGVRMEDSATLCNLADWRSFRFIDCRFENYAGTAAPGKGFYIAGGNASFPPMLFLGNYWALQYPGAVQFDMATAVGKIQLVGETYSSYTDVSGTGTEYLGRHTLALGNPGSSADVTIQAVASGTNANLLLSPKGPLGRVYLPREYHNTVDVVVSANGQTIDPCFQRVSTLNGSGGSRTGTILSITNAINGQRITLIGYTWSVALATTNCVFSSAGAPTFGNSAGQVCAMEMIYIGTLAKWVEVSRVVQ